MLIPGLATGRYIGEGFGVSLRRRTTAIANLAGGSAGLDSHAPMTALALLLFGLAIGTLLAQLPKLLRIVEQTGDALLVHTEALALALPCKSRREMPVVVFKHIAHTPER